MKHRKGYSSHEASRPWLGIVPLGVALLVGSWLQPCILCGETLEQKDKVIYRSVMTERERHAREMEEISKQNLSRRMLENIIIEISPSLKPDPTSLKPSPRR